MDKEDTWIMFNRFKVHFSRMEKVISPVFMQIGDL